LTNNLTILAFLKRYKARLLVTGHTLSGHSVYRLTI